MKMRATAASQVRSCSYLSIVFFSQLLATEAFLALPTYFSSSLLPKFAYRASQISHLAATPQQTENATSSSPAPSLPAPILNGKRVFPVNVLTTGLKGSGSNVAAVYALLSGDYQRGTDGWESVFYVGVSQNLLASLDSAILMADQETSDAESQPQVKHVRSLSFTFPEPSAMQEVADQWKEKAKEAGAQLVMNSRLSVIDEASGYLFDDEDDDDDDFDDDDDDDWSLEMSAQAMASTPSTIASSPVAIEETTTAEASKEEDAVVSPFLPEGMTTMPMYSSTSEGTGIAFTKESVDTVLDEVRPYLISDGGNVAVVDVLADTKTVLLKLEGACGSCPSSTVTMQMGIERVLRENFGADVVVEQVEDENQQAATELTPEAVQDEINRLAPALAAMGGTIPEIADVDADTGVVKLRGFRGGNKVRQGLELAIQDLPFVNAVQFLSDDE